jgi:predicted enzyme related to lactoylglutathione lyase
VQRVIGIGGVFIKARDPKALGEWYRKHLGIDVQAWNGAAFQSAGGETTVWSLFPEASTYFAPSKAAFMVNYRVPDLDRVLAALRAEGCAVDERTETSEYGKFGWVMDPEGNRLELWQPPAGALPA